MTTHHFENSLEFEQRQQSAADSFYTKYFGASNIERYNTNTNEDLKIQRKDIDVSFVVKGKRISVSEKFRKKDYNDLYIELYSKYPKTLGWMSSSDAEYLTYFFPKRMFLIDKKSLIEFYETKLQQSISQNIIDEFHKNNFRKNSTTKFFVTINNTKQTIKLIQAYNKINDSEWHTIGIAVAFDMLAKNEIYCKEFLL